MSGTGLSFWWAPTHRPHFGDCDCCCWNDALLFDYVSVVLWRLIRCNSPISARILLNLAKAFVNYIQLHQPEWKNEKISPWLINGVRMYLRRTAFASSVTRCRSGSCSPSSQCRSSHRFSRYKSPYDADSLSSHCLYLQFSCQCHWKAWNQEECSGHSCSLCSLLLSRLRQIISSSPILGRKAWMPMQSFLISCIRLQDALLLSAQSAEKFPFIKSTSSNLLTMCSVQVDFSKGLATLRSFSCRRLQLLWRSSRPFLCFFLLKDCRA